MRTAKNSVSVISKKKKKKTTLHVQHTVLVFVHFFAVDL